MSKPGLNASGIDLARLRRWAYGIAPCAAPVRSPGRVPCCGRHAVVRRVGGRHSSWLLNHVRGTAGVATAGDSLSTGRPNHHRHIKRSEIECYLKEGLLPRTEPTGALPELLREPSLDLKTSFY